MAGINPAERDFQVFLKPVGSRCNLSCRYCYYLEAGGLNARSGSARIDDHLLEKYIREHIQASPEPVIRFSWHGGEPTLLGLDTFQKIVELQRRYQPKGRRIANGMQTNGTLLDDGWCRFLADERFAVGLSLDGPEEIHNRNRVNRQGEGSYKKTMRGYELLRRHNVNCDILCVVNAANVHSPLDLYGFFKSIQATYLTFLPLVIRRSNTAEGVCPETVPAEAWGAFLCAVFDEWTATDIGRIKIQIFEEAVRPAFGQDHSLCIFRPVCGDIPVIEHNGDFYSCDHYVDPEHLLGNIRETHLVDLLESDAQRSFGQAKLESLPRYCRACEVLEMCHGECPKNRFICTPDGESGLNFLCEGYRRFFYHCRPFVAAVAGQWRRQNKIQPAKRHEQSEPGPTGKTGRNDPCPCGSGRKFKTCCGR